MVSPKCLLVVSLLLGAVNFTFAQSPAETSEKYWRDFELKRRRYASSRSQQDKQTTSLAGAELRRPQEFDVEELGNTENRFEDEQEDVGQNNNGGDNRFVWPELDIQEISIDPRIHSKKQPRDRAYMLSQKFSRSWNQFEAICKDYHWQAPCVRYQPLYFEDVALERYGQCRSGLGQVIASSGHFFKSAAFLPFHMRHDPPYSCEYPLGYCRPGNCAYETVQNHFWR